MSLSDKSSSNGIVLLLLMLFIELLLTSFTEGATLWPLSKGINKEGQSVAPSVLFAYSAN